jgi:hypothetical protein
MIWTLSQMGLEVHLQGVLDLPQAKIWALPHTQENLGAGYDYISTQKWLYFYVVRH